MIATPILLTIEPGGRLAVQVRDQQGVYIPVHRGDLIKPVAGNWLIPVGRPSAFQILNYHFCDNYTVRTVNGTVSLEDDLIIYTPDSIHAPSFWLDGRRFLFTGYDPAIEPPAVLSPQNGQTEALWFGEINSSAFIGNADITHDKSHFQLSTDPSFGTLVAEEEVTDTLLQWTYQGLIPGQSYYVRVRHEGELP